MEVSLKDIELSYLRQENHEIILDRLLTHISQNGCCQQEENILVALIDGNKRIVSWLL